MCRIKSSILLIIFQMTSCFLACVFSQEHVKHRVFMMGNTADISVDSRFYFNFKTLLQQNKDPFTVVINGDLIQQDVDAAAFEVESARIKKLLTAASGFQNGKVIIVPGDRDWADSGKTGWHCVKELQKLVESWYLPGVKWGVKKGCPGPNKIKLNDDLILIAVNTQWWNHPYDKPKEADAECDIIDNTHFLEEMDDLVNENKDKNVLIAGHFPLVSLGEYGGRIPVQKHISPLPVIGTIKAAYHQNVGGLKDIINLNFKKYRRKVLKQILRQNTLIYLSGHEKNQQVIKLRDNYLINSGAPTKAKFASGDRTALLTESIPGIMELVYFESGEIKTVLHKFQNKQFNNYKEVVLFQSACEPKTSDAPVNTSFVPCKKTVKVAQKMSGTYQGKAAVYAGINYKASSFKLKMLGKHYRDIWISKIEAPYLNLDTAFGGLSIYKKGGGTQTTSLRFKSNHDHDYEYVFRSVNKDPTRGLDLSLKETILSRLLQDQTTIGHPFGAIAVDGMLNQLDILHAHPQLYVLPNDRKLGPFRKKYGNLLGMIEQIPHKPPRGKKGFEGADKIYRTLKMFNKLYDDNDNKVETIEYTKARIFDILIGDWDRHEDNWKWAGYKQGKGLTFRPIPRDRDHAFSLWDGFLPSIADREWAKPSGENFDFKIKGLRSLMWQGRHIDRFLTSQLNRDDWLDLAKEVREKVTDQVIDESLRKMPKVAYDLSGREIYDKLIARKKDLEKYALEYYTMLAKEVDVVGSNKKEFFAVDRNKDGSVEVSMFKISRKEKIKQQMYYRKFLPKETKEIRLFGLQGRDSFNIQGDCEKSIKIRVVGGPHTDIIIDNSRVGAMTKQTLIYERDKESKIYKGYEGRVVKHWNQRLYNYERTSFAYDSYLPLALITYHPFNGYGVRVGVEFTNRDYDKDRFSSKHRISGSATSFGNLGLQYRGRFHDVFKNWDAVLKVYYNYPNDFNFFFGYGNESTKDDDKFDRDFYLTRYNSILLSATLEKRLTKNSSLGFEVRYENTEGEALDNTFVFSTEEYYFGIDPVNFFEGVVNLDLDFRDNRYLPAKGIRFFAGYEHGIVTGNGGDHFGITSIQFEHFSTIRTKLPMYLALKVGGTDTFGEIPFYKQPSLGQKNDLRGFLRHRFTGDARAYFNSELRIDLFNIKPLIPMRIGVKGFYDVGRIIQRGEESNKWHKGVGGGVYIVPYKENFTLNFSIATSKEESFFFRFALGTPFR